MIWRQDDRKNENTPYCFSPLEVGEIERGDLSTCQLFNLSTKIGSGKRIEESGEWKSEKENLLLPTYHSLLTM